MPAKTSLVCVTFFAKIAFDRFGLVKIGLMVDQFFDAHKVLLTFVAVKLLAFRMFLLDVSRQVIKVSENLSALVAIPFVQTMNSVSVSRPLSFFEKSSIAMRACKFAREF